MEEEEEEEKDEKSEDLNYKFIYSLVLVLLRCFALS